MLDFKIKLPRNIKKYLFVFAIIIAVVLLGIMCLKYFNVLKEGFTQSPCVLTNSNIIDNVMYDNVNKVYFYESSAPLTGGCYWSNNNIYKYCPLTCVNSSRKTAFMSTSAGEYAKCGNVSDNCSETTQGLIPGVLFDNVSSWSQTNGASWVVRVRDNISNNIQKLGFTGCETSYNNCLATCAENVTCRNICENIKLNCEYPNKLPGFIPDFTDSTLTRPSQPTNSYNPNSYYYSQNNSNPENNGTSEFASKLASELVSNFAGMIGITNPIAGNLSMPEDLNSQSNLITPQINTSSPTGLFKQYVKNVVTEVNNESSVGIGRVPNGDNPFLCDYIKSSAAPASQSYIQNNPANQTYTGYSAGIAPFF